MTFVALFYLIAIFMLGAILGSFLNVVAVDFMNLYMRNDLENKSESKFLFKLWTSKKFWNHMGTHRSACDTCSVTLTPKELVPVVSYLWQKGQCNSCDTKFSPQHLYVEVLAGIIFTGVFLQIFSSYTYLTGHFLFEVTYMFVFFGLAILLLLFDYKEMIVPNVLVYPMFVLALGAQMLGFVSLPQISITESILAAVLIALPMFLLWAVSSGKWMGMADSKIALVMGALLGVTLGFSALVISFWVGAAVGIVMIISTRMSKKEEKATMETAIPFGPFMILGMWFCYITSYSLFVLT